MLYRYKGGLLGFEPVTFFETPVKLFGRHLCTTELDGLSNDIGSSLLPSRIKKLQGFKRENDEILPFGGPAPHGGHSDPNKKYFFDTPTPVRIFY
jgi:hypothetical protein